jgi:hypothetical protein
MAETLGTCGVLRAKGKRTGMSPEGLPVMYLALLDVEAL